jgi:hypothetical protein
VLKLSCYVCKEKFKPDQEVVVVKIRHKRCKPIKKEKRQNVIEDVVREYLKRLGCYEEWEIDEIVKGKFFE